MLMSSLNYGRNTLKAVTHEGAKVRAIKPHDQLTRLTLAHMLWEGQFYVDGQTSAELIKNTVAKCDPAFVTSLAHTARVDFKMRHVPLLLTRELVRSGKATAEGINNVIQRPDEMAELLSIYWKDGKTALSTQLKKGIALAFGKFPEYSLAKWDKNSAAISMRDVMFLVHPKPVSDAQAEMFKRVANKELKTPDTWEVALSGGADKKETFERLMVEGKLGALAFLRNLRNMVVSGVAERDIREYAKGLDVSKVLPFRYIAAARVVPQLEDMLEGMMIKSLARHEKLPGRTRLLVDVSSSMYTPKVSAKSDITRQDASLALAMLCREICEEVEIFSFSGSAIRIAPRHGFALADAIKNSQGCSGTCLGNSIRETDGKYDRTIVITDEQSRDQVVAPKGHKRGYVINVGSYENGVNHGAWTTVTGFSEAVIDYIMAVEKQN
jgi:60 kDa SS-A/Ro ribonucleoprotein